MIELLAKKKLVEEYLQKTPEKLSAFSFVSIFSWKDFFEFEFRVIKRNLCVFARNPVGVFLYLPPLGENIDGDVVESCFDLMEKENKGNGVSRIENVSQSQLEIFDKKRFSFFKKGYEYCYFKNDLIQLKGNAYKSKRSDYNHFASHYGGSFDLFEDKMTAECLALYERWAEGRKKKYSSDIFHLMIEDNRSVHEVCMKHFKNLDLLGRVVKVNERIEAYSFGYKLNDETFCVLFEIANLSLKGISTFIFREFCRDPKLKDLRFINVMDDFELENVNKTKMSFHPVMLLPSYSVTRKN